MSDLISRDALLSEYKNLLIGYYRVPQEKIHHLITNAPAINSLQNCDTQGEPVLIVGEYMPLKMADILRAMPHGTKLYTAPPQPQEQDELVRKAMKDALEKAAKICEKMQKDENNTHIGEWCSYGTCQIQGSTFAKAIRALIEE